MRFITLHDNWRQRTLPTAVADESHTHSGYEAHANRFRAIANMEEPVTILHVPFSPSDDTSPALGANRKVGATEIVFYYFPSALKPADRDSIMSSVDKMAPIMARSEALELYDGWALEDEVPNPAADKGEKSQVFVNLVGWVDVEAHMQFQASEDFQLNIHHLLGIKELRHLDVFHAKLRSVPDDE